MQRTAHTPPDSSSPLTAGPDETRRDRTARLLAEAAHAPDAERQALESEVIELNMGVARDVARRYHGRGIASDDLDQVAYLGLVKAVRGFDAERAKDFLSYAVPTIRGELRRHFRDAGWMVRPPRSIQELQPQVTAAENELYHELGRSPRPSEIAEHIGEDVEKVIEALAVSGCFAPASLDGIATDGQGDDRGLVDRLGREDVGFSRVEARVALRPHLSALTPRERRILQMWLVDGCTQTQIGRAIGVTQMQVSRLLSGVLDRLRTEMRQAA